MMKPVSTYLKIASFGAAALLIASCAFFQFKKEKKSLKEKEDKYQMLMDLQEQEMEMMRDPNTGTVPFERLKAVEKTILRQRQTRQLAGNGFQLEWTERGPDNIGGRSRSILVDKNDPTGKKIWVGSVGGGLWYTNDITIATPIWQRPTDGNSSLGNDFFTNIAVSALAQDPNDPNIMYMGTGEGFGNSDAQRGRGLYKSLNGGQTWFRYLNTDPENESNFARMRTIQKIVVTSNSTILVAATAPFCNSGGIFRSTNGGNSWDRINNIEGESAAGGCQGLRNAAADIEIASDGTLFASNGIFFDDGVYRSTNDGVTWTQIYTSPSTEARIEIAVAPTDPNRIYLMTHTRTGNALGQLLRCDNAKDLAPTYTTLTRPIWQDQCQAASDADFTRGQAWYDAVLSVDPNDKNTVMVGGVDLHRSIDAGVTWIQISEWANCSGAPDTHADQHGVTYTSSSTGFVINDGGIYTASNLNTNTPIFTSKNKGFNVTQYYASDLNPLANSNNMIAGAQDNGTHKFNTHSINSVVSVRGGDGAFCHISQVNGDIQVASVTRNNYSYTNNNWASRINVSGANTRGRFINPTDFDDTNNLLYTADAIGFYGIVIGIGTPAATFNQTTATAFDAQVSAVKVDPNTPSTVWFGLGNGRFFKVDNAALAVPTITQRSTGLPVNGFLSSIDVEKGNSDHILITYSNYGVNSVWESTNGGVSWTSVEGNLPDMPVRWGIFNPQNNDQVLLGTEVGVWTTTNLNAGTTNWINDDNFVNTRVNMLRYRASDFTIIAATHGRGVYTAQFPPQSPKTTIERQAQSVVGYLAPFGETYYYSTTDGQLLARVENLTSFDYGTLTLSVTRASDADPAPVNFYSATNASTKLAKKTYQFTPQNANANGTYRVTLYYDNAEITAWEMGTGLNWGSIEMVKCSGDINLVTPASPNAGGTVLVQGNGGASKTDALPFVTATFTNTGFSSFGVGVPQSPALPVDLLSFEGKHEKGQNILNWKVANEKNINAYEIQRSSNNNNDFQTIGSVKGSEKTAYSFSENSNGLPSVVYYRLRYDGRFSNMVAIIKNGKDNPLPDFRISPNPVGENARIVFTSAFQRASNLQLFLTEIGSGKVIYQQNINNFEEDAYSLNLANMASGAYILTLKNSSTGEQKGQKLIKR